MRSRSTVRSVLSVAGVIMLTGCGLLSDGRGDIDVTSRTSKAADPLPANGPAPGTFQPAWTGRSDRMGPAEVQQTPARVIGGHVVMRVDDGLQAYNARTGKASWQYREPGRDFMGYAETDGVIVVNTTNDGDSLTSWHTAGLEVTTGRILWENTERWYLAYDEYGIGSSTPAVAAHGTVVVQPEDRDTRLGIDARTGDERWSITSDDLSEGDDCTLKGGSKGPADRPLIPVRLDCAETPGSYGSGPRLDDDVFAAVDAETGELRWSKRVARVWAEAEMRDGYTFFQPRTDGDRDVPPTILGRDGEALFEPKEGTTCSTCRFYVSGHFAALAYREERSDNGSGDSLFTIVDLRKGRQSGRTLRSKYGVLDENWIADGGGRLFRAQRMRIPGGQAGTTLLPIGVEVLDLSTGKSTQMPLPIAAFGPQTIWSRQQKLLGVGGDRLVLWEYEVQGNGLARLSSYRRVGGRKPYELGGVRPEDWPDPCKLVADVPEQQGRPNPGDPFRIGVTTIPRASCLIETEDGLLTIGVLWGAADAEAADRLVDGDKQDTVAGEYVDEIVRTNPGRETLRIGRWILSIETHETVDESVYRSIAKALAAHP